MLKEIPKGIQQGCSRLREKEHLRQRHSTGWPNTFNTLNSTTLNGFEMQHSFFRGLKHAQCER